MTDKELRRLSRRDLIELLCQQKKVELSLKSEIQKLQAQLNERELKIKNARSLADAMVAVNGVMEAAQKAADQYLDEIKHNYANIEKSCAEMIEKTDAHCRMREETTDKLINEKWGEFNQKVEQYLQTHSELEALLENKRE